MSRVIATGKIKIGEHQIAAGAEIEHEQLARVALHFGAAKVVDDDPAGDAEPEGLTTESVKEKGSDETTEQE